MRLLTPLAKPMLTLVLAVAGVGLLAGCEQEAEEHRELEWVEPRPRQPIEQSSSTENEPPLEQSQDPSP